MTDRFESRRARDAVDAYLADDVAVGDADEARPDEARPDGAPDAPASGVTGTRAHHLEVFARCDAAMALASKLSGSPDVAWTFDEARRLARSGPRPGREGLRWYQRPALAWSAAGTATVAALVLAVIAWNPPGVESPAADSGMAGPKITFAPIIVGDDVLNRLANVAPVVMLGDQIPVDGRSIVVLPFASAATDAVGGDDADRAAVDATADAVYDRLTRALSSIPGLYVIAPATAAVYADADLTPEQIAFYLGVRGVIQGHVDTDGERVSLGLRFTDAAGEGKSIDRNFEAPVTQMAMIENDITTSLLDALGAPPTQAQ